MLGWEEPGRPRRCRRAGLRAPGGTLAGGRGRGGRGRGCSPRARSLRPVLFSEAPSLLSSRQELLQMSPVTFVCGPQRPRLRGRSGAWHGEGHPLRAWPWLVADRNSDLGVCWRHAGAHCSIDSEMQTALSFDLLLFPIQNKTKPKTDSFQPEDQQAPNGWLLHQNAPLDRMDTGSQWGF